MRKKILSSFILLSLAATLSLIIIVVLIARDLPNIASLQYISYQMPMRIYSSEGEIFGEFGHTNREPVTFEKIPKPLIHALIATEDARFYSHTGVDMKGIARAGILFLKSGKKTQGASTITMQVARNFFLHRKKTWLRKLKEIVLAYQIDQFYTKDQVLTLYLNEIFFGNHAYGINAASHNYYGKDVSELELSEMAMLAGLPKAPSAYNPIISPDKAIARRNHVLRRMYEVGYIDQRTFDNEIVKKDHSKKHARKMDFEAPHIADMIRQHLYDQFGDKAYTMGLEITTTINKDQQLQAQAAVMKNLEKLQSEIGPQESKWTKQGIPKIKVTDGKIFTQVIGGDYDYVYIQNTSVGPLRVSWQEFLKNVPEKHHSTIKSWNWPRWLLLDQSALSFDPENEAALITIHAPTGAITALVGGYDFNKSAFNRTTQAWRQIGSIVKPFILAAGIESHLTLSDKIMDSPVVIDSNGSDQDWRPNNVDMSFRGQMNLRDGVVYSRNLVMVRLLSQLDMQNVIQLLKRFGFNPEKQNNSLSLALGSGIATPSQVAAAYIPFLNSGSMHTPFIIKNIQNNDGNVTIKQNTVAPGILALQEPVKEILNPQRAYLVYDVLKDVVQRGTARRIKTLNRKDMIGKTGTTNQQRDAWFVGSVGPYISAVWVGNDHSLPIKKYGSQVAIPLWLEAVTSWQKNVKSWVPPRPEYLLSKRMEGSNKFELYEQNAEQSS